MREKLSGSKLITAVREKERGGMQERERGGREEGGKTESTAEEEKRPLKKITLHLVPPSHLSPQNLTLYLPQHLTLSFLTLSTCSHPLLIAH